MREPHCVAVISNASDSNPYNHHNKIRSHLRAYAATMLLAAGGLLPFTAHAAAVGATPGSFSVSGTGASQYTIPVVVPPGIAGLQPGVSLHYSSRRDDGLAGVGWDIGGLSAMTRCPKTLAQDNAVRGIEYDAQDRFCLDGMRLRLQNGTYGANGALYRTELEAFARITSFTSGGAGYTPSSGPQWFKVEGKDGLIYEYGATEESRVEAHGTSIVRVWALNKISDRNGNYVTFHYAKDNGAYRPTEIRYTGSTAAAPAHKVVFSYETRPSADSAPQYLAGYQIQQRYRLTNIKTYHGAGLIRDYRLGYEAESAGITGRSRLAGITECAGGECYPATQIGWQHGAAGLLGAVDTGEAQGEQAYAHAIDVNGDGRDDLVYPHNSRWRILLAQPSGGYQLSCEISGFGNLCKSDDNYQLSLSIDYDGDSKRDLLVPHEDLNRWKVLRSTGTNFELIDSAGANIEQFENAYVADVNGDGLEDLLWGSGYDIWARFNTGGGFAGTATKLITLDQQLAYRPFGKLADSFRGRTRLADFNGDGRADVMVKGVLDFCGADPDCNIEPRDQWHILVSTGNALVSQGQLADYQETEIRPLLLDINGDGLTDTAYVSDGTWHLRISNGRSLNWIIDTGQPSYDFSKTLAYDYDGDGKDDILMPVSGRWHVLYSTGASLAAPVDTGVNVPGQEHAVKVADADGDSLWDTLYVTDSNVWKYRLGEGPRSDLVSEIRDGFGNVYRPRYAPLTDVDVYTQQADAGFPVVRDYQGGLHVVREYDASNGVGGTYTVSYQYEGAKIHTRGRGFLGFHKRTVTDNRNAASVHTVYRQGFPFTGMVLRTETRQPNGTLVSKTENTFNKKTWGTSFVSERYFPYVETQTKNIYEVGGPYDGQLAKTLTSEALVYDNYGNLTNSRVTTADTAGNAFLAETTVTDILNDTSQWCLGRPERITVRRTLPDGAYEIRERSTTYDAAKCRATTETVVAVDPVYGDLSVTTGYEYDAWGNPATVTVTGANMAPRVTRADYTATGGYFPGSVTNPLGHVTQRTWDLAHGVETERTDANGVSVSWEQDPFGRPLRELRPDGTATVWSYEWCATNCGVSHGQYRITTTQLNWASQTAAGSGYIVNDGFGRAVRRAQTVLGGAESRVDTVYDELGRVAKISSPYLAGAPRFWTTYTYDLLDRVLVENRPVSEAAPSGSLTENSYEKLITRQTDANGNTTVRETNARGQVVTMTDALGGITRYTYDPFGNLLQTTDPTGNRVVMEYDVRGFKRHMNDPDMGEWAYAYNPLGELTGQTDAKGQSISQSYDKLGRLVYRSEPEGETVWVYDGPGGAATAPYIGRLYQVTQHDGYSETYSYDNIGRPGNVRTTADGVDYDVSTTYDGHGRIETIRYPESLATHDNTAPVAEAGAPQNVTPNTAVTLDGGGSYDPDDGPEPLGYLWEQTGGPAVTLTGANQAAASFTPAASGIYTFRLSVGDGLASASDTTSVTVNAPPGVSAGSDQSLLTDGYTGVTLYGSATDDGLLYPLAYQWSQVSGPSVSISNATQPQAGFVAETAGTYQFRLAVNDGQYTRTDDVNITADWTAPGAPGGVSASNPDGAGAHRVSWNAPSGAVPVVEYRVYRSKNGGSYQHYSTVSSTYKDTGSQYNGTYRYKVKACNGTGCSAYSTASNLVTVARAPEWVSAPTSSDTGNYTVSWAGPVGDGYVDSYKLYEKFEDNSWSLINTLNGTTTSQSFSNKADGHWTYKVKACVGTTCSAYSPTDGVFVFTEDDGGCGSFGCFDTKSTPTSPETLETAPTTTTQDDDGIVLTAPEKAAIPASGHGRLPAFPTAPAAAHAPHRAVTAFASLTPVGVEGGVAESHAFFEKNDRLAAAPPAGEMFKIRNSDDFRLMHPLRPMDIARAQRAQNPLLPRAGEGRGEIGRAHV